MSTVDCVCCEGPSDGARRGDGERGDPPEPRTRPIDVHDDTGELGGREVGDALLHQRDTDRGRRRDDPVACRGCAIHHVDAREFALGLEEGATFLGEPFGEILEEFPLWSDRIPVEMRAASPYRGFAACLVALQ